MTVCIQKSVLLMAGGESKKKKKKVSEEAAPPLSWPQKKAIADAEEEAVGREVEELISWTRMIEAMDDNQLKEYLMKRPEILQNSRTWKGGSSRKLLRVMQAQRSIKPRSSSSSSQGLMASIWKFHREEEEEEETAPAAASMAFQV